ncbi:hypothetical protein Ssi03_13320 [Sphaerisporangium siamense]|uniref:Putative cobalt transporter CbtA n=1 Tax=Sphaerisporangium siamense TaxID=795645 RepID=A0A7W7D9S6_9ACTN|nr:hypothetical protein [Sphaerisporangium siamense]MBB4702899.1 putative cobalt transporter CbtA [Sphaerisporangium siamense]GII83342.1 hypothetical protein Ssi03_13320 [Sphaerisporangium siamense]
MRPEHLDKLRKDPMDNFIKMAANVFVLLLILLGYSLMLAGIAALIRTVFS